MLLVQISTWLLFKHHVRIPGKVGVPISFAKECLTTLNVNISYFYVLETFGTHKLHEK